MTTTSEPSLVVAACMIINSIDAAAQADADTMLLARVTTSHVVVITHRGQKFAVPIGTVKAAAQAQAKVPPTGKGKPQPDPTKTIKARPQPATTVKKTSAKRPTTARKPAN